MAEFPKFKEMVNSISEEDMKQEEPIENAEKSEAPKDQPKDQEQLPDY